MRRIALTTLLFSSALLSSAQADRLSVTATGLPAGLSAKVTVGKVTANFTGTQANLTLNKGTYTVTPSAATDGRKVYVAQPVKVTVKGNSVARVTYTKLAPGSLDPFFGKGGVIETKTPGLEISDSWTVGASGPSMPIITVAGSFTDIKGQLLSATGNPLGPVTKLAVPFSAMGNFYRLPPMIQDGDGYLMGTGYNTGTVIRFTAKGQFDPTWKTAPETGIYVRGLLRMPDGGLLAYGGETSPAIWRLDAGGKSVETFGKAGVVNLTPLISETKMGFNGVVTAARVMEGGTVRLAVVSGSRMALVETSADGQTRLVAAPAELPMNIANVVLNADGSAVGTAIDVLKNKAQLWRITANGTIDNQFRSPVLQDIASVAGLVIQRDGKLVAALNDTYQNGVVVRFNASGSLDTTFGKGGKAALPSNVAKLTTDANGKLRAISLGTGDNAAFIRITQLLSE